MKKPIILGIETSCDETSAAVYHHEHGMLSNVIYSQIKLHVPHGGVLPEVASRTQLEKINPIVQEALEQANMPLRDISAIAVTHKPGLAGSLLVGVCFAKSLAWSTNKKLIGVNHLEGHAFSASIEHKVPFPHLCITASGGHTSLYLMHDYGRYEILGQTIDDAAGEAFDKIARLLQLPYPGGPEIERCAAQAGFIDVHQYPRSMSTVYDFSFSGLKTAVLYDLVQRGLYDIKEKKLLTDDIVLINQVASSLLVCIADIFQQKVSLGLKNNPTVKAVTFVGGVACNKYIKERLRSFCAQKNVAFYTPSPQYCTDNGGMIAFVGYYKALQSQFSDFDLDILR